MPIDPASTQSVPLATRTRALTVLLWIGFAAVGALLLSGRFDWQESGGRFARPGYLCSLYFFLLIVPTAYYLTRALTPQGWTARVVAALVFLAGALPYRWLGLQALRSLTTIYPPPPDTKMEWLPQALERGGFPGEIVFFMGLGLALTALTWLLAGGARRRTWPSSLTPVVVALVAILVQMWLHTSMRSPYTYTQYFEDGGLHHKCLLPGGFAAVNGDVAFFTDLNDLFNGLPRPASTMLLRRSFLHYLSSSFTYFWNPFHVYLVLNATLWLAAVLSTYGWVRRVVEDSRAPILAAALVCIGNGFVYFAAQPMHYLAGYAAVAIALYLFERLVVEQRRALLFGVTLGFCAATYDLFPLYPGLLLYGHLRRVPWTRTGLGLLVSLAVYGGFLLTAYRLVGLPNDAYNTDHGTSALSQILRSVRHPNPGELYLQAVTFVRVYVQNLAFAFFLIGALAAALAFWFLTRPQQKLVLVLLVPSLLLNAYLFFGRVPWAGTLLIELPRFTYIAYPAVYLTLALGLARLPARWAWAAMGLLLVWHNVDVVGLPDMHFHFYFPQKLFFLRG